MTPKQIDKLYGKLSPHEQAAMVFEAATRLDEPELDKILGYVEKKDYRTLHADFQRWIIGLQRLSLWYGVYYHKTLFKLATYSAASSSHADDFELGATRYIAELNAMDAAMTSVCKDLKVNIEVVRKFAEVDYRFELEVEPDKEMIEQYTKLFLMAAQVQ